MSEPRSVNIAFTTPTEKTESVSIHVRIGCGSYRILRVPKDSLLLIPLLELIEVPETEM